MNDKIKTILTTTSVIASIGIGLYLISKLRRRMAMAKRIPFNSVRIKIVNNTDECKTVVKELREDCKEYNILGFDCEWVTVNGSRRPIALLQLATHRGLCALIRLCSINNQTIPAELIDLLGDHKILKVGVTPFEDAQHLYQDYNIKVYSSFDLNHLAAELKMEPIPMGLASIAQNLLNMKIEKDWRIRASDWEKPDLSQRQIEYAAKDSYVAIESFKYFTEKLAKDELKPLNKMMDICEPNLDTRFKGKNPKNKSSKLSKNNELFSNNKDKKMLKRELSTRSAPLYDNCHMEAPDGELLCTCDHKKAQWYIQKNLAVQVKDDPFTIRLNFEPSGRAVGDVGKYYQLEKLNECVVCGRKDSYLRKNVVPREYRKYFPTVMKEHTSHDVLLLCFRCHQKSNMEDLKLRKYLSNLCLAPLEGEEGGRKETLNLELNEIKKAAKALYTQSNKIPESRKKELREKLLNYFPLQTIISDAFLAEYSNIDVINANELYCAHGEKVVEHFRNEMAGLVELERLWRQHFLDYMKPKHLPELWSVDHNIKRLTIRAGEGRVDEEDLIIAGLKTPPEMVESTSSSLSIKCDPDNDSTVKDVSSCFEDMNTNTKISQYLTAKSDSNEDITLDLNDDYKSCQVTEHHAYESDDTDSTLSQPSSRTTDDFDDDEIENAELSSKSDDKIKENV